MSWKLLDPVSDGDAEESHSSIIAFLACDEGFLGARLFEDSEEGGGLIVQYELADEDVMGR